VTTESLIPRLDVTDVQQNPDAQSTGTTPDQAIEPNMDTSTSTAADTSIKGLDADVWEKRYKDLQSFQSKRENEMRKEIAELQDADSTFTAPTTPEQLEVFKEEHPEVYNMMLTLAHQKATEATQGINMQLQTIEEERNVNAFLEAQQQLKNAHPDYETIVRTSEFQEWAKVQPASVQQWIFDNPDNPELAGIALDRFKAHREATKAHLETEAQKKADTQSAALAVGSSSIPKASDGKKVWTASEIKSLHPNDYRKYAAEIDVAYDEGRVNFKA